MYAGNIERRKYMNNGGCFRTPAIFTIFTMEEINKNKLVVLFNTNLEIELLFTLA